MRFEGVNLTTVILSFILSFSIIGNLYQGGSLSSIRDELLSVRNELSSARNELSSVNKKYQALIKKEGLNCFEYYTKYILKRGYLRSVKFIPDLNRNLIKVSVWLQNSTTEIIKPDYKIIVFDKFGMEMGSSHQTWIISELKPGEAREQEIFLSVNYVGNKKPAYVRFYTE